MLSGVRAIANEYTIPILLDIGLVSLFFGDFDAGKAFKYLKVVNVLLFMDLHFFRNELFSLVLCWQLVLEVIGNIYSFCPEI